MDLEDFEIVNLKNKDSQLRIGGVISSVKLLFDKRNNQWAIITLERMSSKAEIFVFHDLYDNKKSLIKENNIIFVSGKISNRQSSEDDVLKIIANDIIEMKSIRSKMTKHIHIKLTYNQTSKELIDNMKSLISEYSGNCRFVLNLESSSGHCHKVVSDQYYVSSNVEFIIKLRDLLGLENVWVGS